MKYWISIIIFLLFSGCSQNISADNTSYGMLQNIYENNSKQWTADDYILVLSTPRASLYEIGQITDGWGEEDPKAGMGVRNAVFNDRFFGHAFGQNQIEFYRYFGPDAANDQPLFITDSLTDWTVQDVFEEHGAAPIIESIHDDFHPAGGTTIVTYFIFYHIDKLLYIYDLRHYGSPLIEEEQQELEVIQNYILLEENPLIDQQGNLLYPDLYSYPFDKH